MARRKNTAEPTSEVEAPESTEAETNEATNEPTEAPTEKKAEETPADLTNFQSAVQSAVEERDSSTGELPEAALASVNEAYRSIDGLKGKNAARAWVEEQMKAAIVGQDIQLARAYVSVKDNLSAGSASKERTPVDPTTAFVQKIVSLELAKKIVASDVPEGVAEDWRDQANKLVSDLTGDVEKYAAWQASDDEDAEAPEVSPVVRQAFKYSAGRGSSSTSHRAPGAPRRDIEKHLQQVFADEPVGAFLTINEIAKRQSTEYGDDRPSAGAVSARLFPKTREAYNANGIQATAEEGKPRGATKVA